MVTLIPVDGAPLGRPGPSTVAIRPARKDEVEPLQRIERSAAQAFRLIEALSWIATGDVQDAGRHLDLIAKGTNWVATADGDSPVGFLSAEIAGPELHIWEISVDHLHQGFGIGRKLIRHAVEAAAARGLAAVTLTTFRTIPWNCPFYERLGFSLLDEAGLSPRLAGVLDMEAEHGLPRDTRCAMRLTLPAA
ncbi:GNAT family N-acetyltransferase [Shinella zoogloeoides]|uniref:GNAT family N-acetyltransferase n=1 Tax=Shinella zoogloeoides TaxID=352475 RepID=UPI001F580F39|nr:GNAT family N-acetyltransferase [Shinella zoogloeoides]